MASSKFTSKVPSLASRMSAFMLSLKTQKSSKTRLLVPKNTGDNLPPTPCGYRLYGERLVYPRMLCFLRPRARDSQWVGRGDSGDGDGGKWRWQERLL